MGLWAIYLKILLLRHQKKFFPPKALPDTRALFPSPSGFPIRVNAKGLKNAPHLTLWSVITPRSLEGMNIHTLGTLQWQSLKGGAGWVGLLLGSDIKSKLQAGSSKGLATFPASLAHPEREPQLLDHFQWKLCKMQWLHVASTSNQVEPEALAKASTEILKWAM